MPENKKDPKSNMSPEMQARMNEMLKDMDKNYSEATWCCRKMAEILSLAPLYGNRQVDQMISDFKQRMLTFGWTSEGIEACFHGDGEWGSVGWGADIFLKNDREVRGHRSI